MDRRRILIGSTVVLLGAASPMQAQQQGYQPPGVMPGRPLRVEPVQGPAPVQGFAAVQPVNGFEEPKMTFGERTKMLLYRLGILKDPPIVILPGTITRAQRDK